MRPSSLHTSLTIAFCGLFIVFQLVCSQISNKNTHSFQILKKDQQTGTIRLLPVATPIPFLPGGQLSSPQLRLENEIAFQKRLAEQINEQRKLYDAQQLVKRKDEEKRLLQAPKLTKIQAFGRETEFYQGPALPVNRSSSFATHAVVSNVSINGEQSDTISTGDAFTLSFSFAPNTVSAVVNIFVDMNNNGIIDSADAPIILNGLVFDNGEYDKNSVEGEYTLEFEKGNFYSLFIASLIFEVNDFYNASTALLSIKDKMSSKTIIGKVYPYVRNAYMFVVESQSNKYWYRYIFPDTSGQYIFYHDTTASSNIIIYSGIAGNTPTGYLPLLDTTLTVKNDTTRFFRVHMAAREFIEGYIKDQNGDPVVGAIVRGWMDCYSCNDFRVRTTTNAQGYYKVSAKSGTWRMSVVPPSIDGEYMLNDVLWRYVNVTSNQTAMADFTLHKINSSISGSVKYGTVGVGGMPIVAYRDSIYHFAFTSGDGSYALKVYTPYTGTFTYTLNASIDDYGYVVDSMYRFNVAPGATNINFTVTKVTGGIQGRLVDINTGLPIGNASIYIAGQTSRYFRSNDSGYFKALLPAGVYSLEINAQYYDRYYEQNIVVSSAMITKNIALTRTGSFSGTVTDELGVPIPYAIISARDSLGYYYYGSSTDAQGKYVVGELPSAKYKAQARAQGFVPQWYNKKSTVDSATLFTVTKGYDTPNINFILSRGGTISGAVKDKNGNGIADIAVFALDTLYYVVSLGITNDTGGYVMGGLTTGKYYVATYSEEYLDQWYDGKINYQEATKVSVVIYQNTPNINFTLLKGAIIAGTVTNKSGEALEGINVEAYDSNFYSIRYASTYYDGKYELKKLSPGIKYFVSARGYAYAPRWYNNALTQETATPIVLTTEERRENINFVLPQAGKISGSVQDKNGVPIVSANVYAMQLNGYNSYYGYSDNTGNYIISGIPSGKYIVSVSHYDYLQQWYNQKSSVLLADTILVEEEKTTSNINFVLVKGGTITGTVKTLDNTPVPYAGISVNSVFGGNYYSASADNLGNYSVFNINPGKYWVSAYSYDYGTQWYDHKTSIADADTVTVEAEKTVPNINFEFKSLSSDSVVVKVVVDDLPDVLKFSQSHVGDYYVDYWWGVRFDVNADNDFETEIALLHAKGPGEAEFTADPVLASQRVVIQWVGNTGYSVHSNVRVWRNQSEKNILYLAVPKSWSEIQGMNASSKFYGHTLYYSTSGQVSDMTATGIGETTISDAKGDIPHAFADIITAGWKTQLMSVEKTDVLPLSYSLEQNFPNPFNPSTTIRFAIPVSGFTSLKVFNLLGQEVATLVSEELPAGWKEVTWNASGISSGIYFYTLRAGNFVEVKKMLMLK